MKSTISAALLATAFAAGLMAQPAPAKGPSAKSQPELDAVKALFAASGDPDACIKAAEDLLGKYKDTQFKEIALYFEAHAYQAKGDGDRAEVYAEKVLEVNPKNFQSALLIGENTAQHIRENDLNKADEVAKAEKYLNQSIESIKVADKPAQLNDADWEAQKKIVIAEAHAGIGIAALADKKFEKAAAEFKTASDMDPGEPVYFVRLASSHMSLKKYDEAVAACDKALAVPNILPQVKTVATNLRNDANKAKGAK